MAKTDLTAERLREILDYDPETGVFTWIRESVSSYNRRAGLRAGSKGNEGYRSIFIDRQFHYSEHRLAWLYMFGAFPPECIDHINGIRDDNRIGNLRLSTKAENGQNRAARKTSTSGLVGVSQIKGKAVWEAYIRVNRVKIHLGLFPTKEDAGFAYAAAKAQYHPFNPCVRVGV